MGDGDSSEGFKRELKGKYWALGGAAVACAAALGSRVLVGQIYGQAESIQLIEGLADSALYFGAAVATSSTTILALMLTLLGMTNRVESDFDLGVFHTINRICVLSTSSLCGAILLLLLLSFPVGEFEQMPSQWYPRLYEILVGLVALLAALLIGTVLLLLVTIRHVIAAITPTDEV